MVHRILIFSIIAGLCAACRSKEPFPSAEEQERRGAPAENAMDEGAQEDEPVAKNAAGRASPFGHSALHVFGIKIPTGMTPSPGPEKVYRFHGKLPALRAAGLIRDQINVKKEVKEEGGVLFRFAKSKKLPAGSNELRMLAIRVFPAADGSTVDIWLEKEYTSELPDIHQTTNLPIPTLPPVHRTVIDKRKRASELNRRTQAVNILQKIERGEPLTPEEAASGLLD